MPICYMAIYGVINMEENEASISIEEFRNITGRGSTAFLEFMLANKGKAYDLDFLSKKFNLTTNSIKAKKSEWNNKEGYKFATRTTNGKKYLGLIEDIESEKQI
jgi:hypothetical protein